METKQLEAELARRSAEMESVEKTEVARLSSELAARSQTIQLLVNEKCELESLAEELGGEKRRLEESKVSLELSVDQLGAACSELREQLAVSTASTDQQVAAERQREALQAALDSREHNYTGKLRS